MECYHESRRICRLADWLPRMPPCPAMKSRGSIRVEVHVAGGTVQYWTVAMGVWRMRWYLTIYVRNPLPGCTSSCLIGAAVCVCVCLCGHVCLCLRQHTYIQTDPLRLVGERSHCNAVQCYCCME